MKQIYTLLPTAKLTLAHRICLESWLHHGYDVQAFTYSQPENLPRQVKLQDANEILPERETSNPAGWNYFRFTFLYQHGGTWLDTDIVLLKTLDEIQTNSYACSSHAATVDHNFAGAPNFFYAHAPAGWPLMQLLAKEVLGSTVAWQEKVLPWLRKHDQVHVVLPAVTFCPQPITECQSVFRFPPWRPQSPRTVGVKLWTQKLRQAGCDCNTVGKRSSFLWWAAKTYLGVDLSDPDGYNFGRPRKQTA